MAVPLETLIIKISADLSDLRSQMGRANTEIRKGTARVDGSLGRSALAWAKWAAIAIGAYKAVSNAMQQLDIVDQMAKQARALNASIQFLAALQFQAKDANVSIEQLNVSLRAMTRRVGAAATIGGPAAAALKRMNINAKELARLSLDEQYAAIIKGMAGIDSTSKQAAVAMEIFGDSWAGMLLLAQQGTEGLEDARNATERYGTALTALDAEKIENIKRASLELSEAWSGFVRRSFVEGSEAIVAALRIVTQTLDSLRIAWLAVKTVVLAAGTVIRVFWDELTILMGKGINQVIKDVNSAIMTFNRARTEWQLFLGATVSKPLDMLALVNVGKLELEAKNARKILVNETKATAAEIAEISEGMAARQAVWAQEDLERSKRTEEEKRGNIKATNDAIIMSTEERVGFVAGLLGNLSSAMDQESKKQFEVSKNLNIAETIMNTAAAVMNIWARFKGNPLAVGSLAGVALATGALQVAKIQATTFGGGGSVGGGGGAAPAAVGAGGGIPTQDVNVNISGSGLVGGEGIRQIITELDAARADDVRANYNVTVSQ